MPCPWPRAVAFVLVLAPLALPVAAQPAGEAGPALSFELPSASLGETLNAIARQGGRLVVLDPALVAGRSAPAVRGEMTVEQAMRQALAGSGLALTVSERGTLSVAPAPPEASALELDATTVIARPLLGETTEGTGAYTSGRMATATRLPIAPRETPQAATVITRQRMDDQGMTSITDVVRNTPGLFLSQADGPGRPSFNARGFNIDAVMYDGLPTFYENWTVGIQPNLAMFDRVEVVRGATGLITGSGNPSAAINLVRKRPTVEPQVNLTAAAGRWDDYRGEVDASGALNASGSLRGRVVGSYRDTDSFRDEEAHDHGLFYAIGEADLSARTTLSLGAYRQEDRTNFFWGGLPLTEDGRHMDLSRSRYPGTDWEDKHQETDAVFAELRHRFDNDWQVRLATLATWQDALFSGTYYYRATLTAPLQYVAYQSRHDEDQQSADLYASGPVRWFGREHDLVIGASRRQFDMTTLEYDPYTVIDLDAPKPDFVPGTTSRYVTTQEGVYLTSRLSLADPLRLILGGRLDWYEYDDRSGAADYRVNRQVTRYAGLIYDLDAHHSLYASYTDIFQPQSYKDTSGSILEPIVGENYEIGIKGDYYGGALNATLALFQIDQRNRGSRLADQSGCPSYPTTACYDAAGLVRSQGVDLELQGALTDDWQVGAGYTYTRARYKKDQNPANEDQRFQTDQPEHMLKASTVYHLAGSLERWRVGGTLYWQSRIYQDVTHAGGVHRLEQGSYALLDLLLGYQATPALDLQLNIGNALDRTYYAAIGSSVIWGPTDTYGTPRNYLLTARYSF